MLKSLHIVELSGGRPHDGIQGFAGRVGHKVDIEINARAHADLFTAFSCLADRPFPAQALWRICGLMSIAGFHRESCTAQKCPGPAFTLSFRLCKSLNCERDSAGISKVNSFLTARRRLWRICVKQEKKLASAGYTHNPQANNNRPKQVW